MMEIFCFVSSGKGVFTALQINVVGPVSAEIPAVGVKCFR